MLAHDKCTDCGNCSAVCPTFAMTVFGIEYTVDQLVEDILVDKEFFSNSGGGITLSGGECLAQPDFAIELAKKLTENGISVNIDTCGYVKRQVLECIMPYTDTFLYDVKAIDSHLLKTLTGKDNRLILDNLKFLIEHNAKVEVRFPLVVGVNDNQAENIGEFLSGFINPPKIKVLQYHSFARSRYLSLGLKNTLPTAVTTPSDVENAVNTLKKYNLIAINGITEN